MVMVSSKEQKLGEIQQKLKDAFHYKRQIDPYSP